VLRDLALEVGLLDEEEVDRVLDDLTMKRVAPGLETPSLRTGTARGGSSWQWF